MTGTAPLARNSEPVTDWLSSVSLLVKQYNMSMEISVVLTLDTEELKDPISQCEFV
jgi:hypothetical protein